MKSATRLRRSRYGQVQPPGAAKEDRRRQGHQQRHCRSSEGNHVRDHVPGWSRGHPARYVGVGAIGSRVTHSGRYAASASGSRARGLPTQIGGRLRSKRNQPRVAIAPSTSLPGLVMMPAAAARVSPSQSAQISRPEIEVVRLRPRPNGRPHCSHVAPTQRMLSAVRPVGYRDARR